MKKIVYIKGMHCVSCEMLLSKGVDEIKGAKIINISHKSGKVTLELKTQNIFSKVKAVILENGYILQDNKQDKQNMHDINNNKNEACVVGGKNKNSRMKILIIFVAWGLIFLLLKKINIYEYLPNLSNKANIGVALLMGLVASLSTCLAVTGSIVLGFGKYIDSSKSWLSHLRVQGSFHIGRIGGFFLLGGLLGLLGQVFKISISANAILTIIVGIVLFYMGLHMLGIVPSITNFGFHLPKSLSKNILNIKNPIFAPVIGALTFFLPCGFTQSMQLVAMSSGSFWQGGLVMAMFALGTMPILLGVGLSGSYIREHKFSIVNKIIGALIVFFGIFSISNGWSLFGGINTIGDDSKNITKAKSTIGSTIELADEQLNQQYEKIEVGHNGWSLEPKKVILEANKNYELTILPTKNGIGCMSTMIIPKISRDVNHIIKGQKIVYKLDGLKKGIYSVVCASMGMYQGELVVK